MVSKEWIAGYVARLLEERGASGLTDEERAQIDDLVNNGLSASDIGVLVQAYDADTLKADQWRELSVGFTAQNFSAGIISAGDFRPNPQSGLFQSATNDGAHTLLPPVRNCQLIVDYTNGSSAGAIDTTAFDTVVGTPNTTAGHVWRYQMTVNSGRAYLEILDMQPGGTPLTRIIELSGNMAFGQQNVGTTHEAVLTISNTGTDTLLVDAVDVPEGFTVDWSGGTIAASGSQDVTVTFSPIAQQSYDGTLQVVSNATSGTETIALTGSGQASPTKVLSLMGNLAFPSVDVGQTDTAVLTLTNVGNSPIAVTSLTYPTAFSGAWSGTLVAGASQLVTVTFAPLATGSFGGSVVVASDQVGGDDSIPISGTGTTVPEPPSGDEVPATVPPVGRPTTTTRAYGYDVEVSGNVYDVVAYGAAGDGDSNDTAAIRAAIAACKAAGGGHVYFPAGTYRVWPTTYGEEIFTIDFGNVAFVGDGKATTTLECWTIRADGSGPVHPETSLVEKRGNGFRVGAGDSPIQKIVFSGLTMDGQTLPNQFAGGWNGNTQKFEADGVTLTAGWTAAEAILAAGELDGLTSFPTRALGWDTAHKAIGTWGRTDQILVTDCAGIGWRAEIFYSGGDTELGRYYIARTEIAYSNGSATSIGHRTIYDDVDVWAVYNGVENFCRGISDWAGVGAQGAWLRNCRIRSNYDWPAAQGSYGVVYLGFRDSWLTVEDCEIAGSNDAAIFLSEYAHNVLIEDNLITDTKILHLHNLGLYAQDPPEEYYSGYSNLTVRRNTCTVTSGTLGRWLTNYSGRGLHNNRDWVFEDNVVTGSYSLLFDGAVPALANGEFRFEGNNFSGVSNALFNIGDSSRRPQWINNTVSAALAGFDKYSDSPYELGVTSRPYPVGVVGSNSTAFDEAIAAFLLDLDLFPTDFELRIYREPGATRADIQGVQVVPDGTWNTLTRGYGIYTGAELLLKKSAGSGKFEFVSYTAPTTSPSTITDTLDRVRFRGLAEVTMNPSSAVTYTAITGLPEGVSGTLNYNANLTIQHQAGVLECPGAVDFAPGATGSCTVEWDGTKHTVTT